MDSVSIYNQSDLLCVVCALTLHDNFIIDATSLISCPILRPLTISSYPSLYSLSPNPSNHIHTCPLLPNPHHHTHHTTPLPTTPHNTTHHPTGFKAALTMKDNGRYVHDSTDPLLSLSHLTVGQAMTLTENTSIGQVTKCIKMELN